MNTIKYILIAIMCVVGALLSSCDKLVLDKDLREALYFAGDNKEELEQVIEHYKTVDPDELKLRATLYLIGNMTYHRSYPTDIYAKYASEVDSLFINCKEDSVVKDSLALISKKYNRLMTPLFDVKEISADYLIWNIDYSFKQWKTSDFLQHLDFEMFCEYVLPYKVAELQPIDRWKESYASKYRGEMDKYHEFPELRYNVRRAVQTTQEDLDSNLDDTWQSLDCIPLVSFPALSNMHFGTCIERSVLGLLNSRSKSLPVCMDMSPSWPDRNGVHHWNYLFTSERRDLDYQPFKSYPGGLHYTDHTYAKVYRYKYRPNRLMLDVLKKNGVLPGNLNIFLHDVTAEYCKTSDIYLSLEGVKRGDDFACLCVFDNYKWTPVAFAEINCLDRCAFTDVGVGVMYLPAILRKGGIVPAGNPFILDTRKRIYEVNSRTDRMIDIHLTRKYPPFYHIFKIRELLKGGVIEASENYSFKKFEVMSDLSSNSILAGEKKVTDPRPFRYWRLRGTYGTETDFAEIFFRDTSGRILSPEAYVCRNSLPYLDEAGLLSDRDPLTFCALPDSISWVGFDFGKPVSLSDVSYIRRGDGNDICPGEQYELYFWDGNEWRLHSAKTADRVYLDFSDVPADALYYIKCVSSGEQNRIFTINNGEIIWW